MTGQASDHIMYKRRKYALVGVKGKKLFDLTDYEIELTTMCTACWRGFIAKYAILQEKLVLRDLELLVHISESEGVSIPFLKGIEPVESDWGIIYKKIDVPLNFSGKLLIGHNFVGPYIHMGFQRFYTYETVIEFNLLDGKVTGSRDLSEHVKKIRESKEPGKHWETMPELVGWIEDSFSRDYDI